MTLRVIVHAGTHKTGSTAIQQSLQANRTAYAAVGVAVPESVGADHRSLLVPAHRGWSPDHLLAEIQKATDSHAETLVLSSEAVFCMADEELHALTALIGRDRLTFVMTVRHLSTFLPSRWAQDCRRRDSHSLPEYVRKVQDPVLNHIDFQQDWMLNRMARITQGRLAVISYDNAVHRDGTIIAAFLRTLGLDETTVTTLTSAGDAPVNARAQWTTTELSRLLNGVRTNAARLEQNALFSARLRLSQASEFFDLEPRFMRASSEKFTPLIDAIEVTGRSLDLSNQVSVNAMTKRMLHNHGSHFVNLDAGEILPLPSNPVQHSNLDWAQFYRENRVGVDALLAQIA